LGTIAARHDWTRSGRPDVIDEVEELDAPPVENQGPLGRGLTQISRILGVEPLSMSCHLSFALAKLRADQRTAL
jgi:hypothetical protein